MSRKGVQCHETMLQEVCSISMEEADKIVWLDIVPNRWGSNLVLTCFANHVGGIQM